MSDQIISRFLKKYPSLEDQESIAVAVSGGPDSMALANMLVVWATENNKQLHILTLDHGFRTESESEAQMVADWVTAQNNENLHHQILEWQGETPDTAVMEVARVERYRLIAVYCHEHNIQALFLGHHQDDQAETFLIRLAKGSGLDGLASMGEVREYDANLSLVRPLLGISKQDLVEYCDDVDIPYVNDPSNEDDKYLRPRLRHSMDVLEKEGLSPKRLAVTAKRLARARVGLEQISANVFKAVRLEESDGVTDRKAGFDFTLLSEQPEEIGLRVLQAALEGMRPDASYNTRMEKLEELFEFLWFAPQEFKPRTLGGCIISLKKNPKNKNMLLWIEKEKG